MNLVEPAPPDGPHAEPLLNDGPLVEVAVALLIRHTAEVAKSTCRSCGEPYPCESAIHAAMVCQAAGLDPETMGRTTEPARWELAG